MSGIIIIGAGLAGLSAAITLAKENVKCALVSLQISERAQSVLAEGGINAALGSYDSAEEHFNDTMSGGCFLADPNAVYGLTENAPEIVRWLENLGVPFNRQDGEIALRSFGGQKKNRTAYAKSSTGKMIMTSLIDEARKYESAGLIERFPHHEFIRLITDENICKGARIRDSFTGKMLDFYGSVILASGGVNGIFPEKTTGTVQNSGDVTATVFSQGVSLGNPEMIQYHPTTIEISGKRCLISEAARGEGGRLFIERGGKRWYFMEEKYPQLKNLMPRDVVSREMFFARRRDDCGDTVYLDMTGIPEDVWTNKLPDLRNEIMQYLGTDPKNTPIAVKEGIHYFMGGILTDENHCTSMENLYAAGECACQYHGANRLGGNSMLGAIYGGKKAALSAISDNIHDDSESRCDIVSDEISESYSEEARPIFIKQISEIISEGMGIVRNAPALEECESKLIILSEEAVNIREKNRIMLALAMVRAAYDRKESRGAHYREDHPEPDENFRKTTVVSQKSGETNIEFSPIPERHLYEVKI
jgi:succinate dehydrogenase / fumarate reductase flavoprotein subunit